MTPAGIVALLEATPRRPADGSAVDVKLCWNAVDRADFFGVQWYPGVLTMPSFEANLGFDGMKFGQGARPTVGQLVIGIDPVTAPYASLVWKNAAMTLKIAPRPAAGDPADGDFAVVWSGRADTLSEKNGELAIVALDAGAPLDKPLQPVLFGTSGSALLDGSDAVDKAGQPVPMGWGTLSAVPGMLVDKSYNIWIVIGRPATAITSIEDGGAPFTLGVARASLADLRATPPAAGAADYCLNADGLVLVRPWTAPTYPLIVDLTTAEDTVADIAAAIVAARSALAFTAGAIAAFDALVPAPAQLYVADGKTIANALDLLFPPLGAYWKINSLGTIDVGRLTRATAPTRDLGFVIGSAVTRLATVMPTGRRTLGYATNNRVLGTNEIAQILTADNAEAIGGIDASVVLAEIVSASAAAATATAELAAIASDNVLTPVEKAIAIRDADVVAAEQTGFDAQADAFAIVGEKATYDAAVGALATYLGELVAPTAWNDLTGNTTIDGPTFRAHFAAVFEAKSTLLTAIAAAAASWANGTGAGRPVTFIVASLGFSAVDEPHAPGLYNGDGSPIVTDYWRSYVVCTFVAGIWVKRGFDVFAAGAIPWAGTSGPANNDAAAMAAYLNGLPNGTPVVVYTCDEPQANRLTGGLDAAMYRCGASPGRFGDTTSFHERGAYLLVGNAGCGSGNGNEQLGGSSDAAADAFCLTSAVMINGVFVLAGSAGDKGNPGEDGVPGEPGADGVTHYRAVAYANASDGSIDFTTGEPTDGGLPARGWQGIADNLTSAVEPTDPTAYSWIRYSGPPNYGIVAVNAQLSASTVISSGPEGWGHAGAYSSASFAGGAYMTVRTQINGSEVFVGLDDDPASSIDYPGIRYSFYGTPTGILQARRFGIELADLGGYTGATALTLQYDGAGHVYWFKDGVQAYALSGEPSDLAMYFDSAIKSIGGRFTLDAFGPAAKSGVNGDPGTPGTPGTPGAPGAPGVSPISLVLNPPAKQIACDSGGTPKSGQLPYNIAVVVSEAGADVTSAAAVTATGNGCSASYASGVVTVSGPLTTTTPSVDVAVTYAGQPAALRSTISRQNDPLPATAAGASIALSDLNMTGSYLSSGPVASLRAPSSGIITVDLQAYYYTGTAAVGHSCTLTGKLQFCASGGTYADISGSAVIGTSAHWQHVAGDPPEFIEGDLNIKADGSSISVSGLTPGLTYNFMFLNYRSAGSENATSGGGALTVAAG